jgi:hypothetical protein
MTAGQGSAVENSVFSNPFRAKEAREKAILERHVEMTARQVTTQNCQQSGRPDAFVKKSPFFVIINK